MKKILILTLMTSLCAFASVQAFDVYNLANSFAPSDPANPIGVWSIGRSTDLTGNTFALNAAYQDNWGGTPGGTSIWWSEIEPFYPGFPGNWPLFWHNFADGANHIQTGVQRPGVNGVVRWTAPSDGLVNIEITANAYYGGVGVVILLNQVDNPDPNAWIIHNAAPPTTYTWTGHRVKAGDIFDLAITAPGGSHDTGVNAIFTLYAIGEPGAPDENNIPEPSPPTPDYDPDPMDPSILMWSLNRDMDGKTLATGGDGPDTPIWKYGYAYDYTSFAVMDGINLEYDKPLFYPTAEAFVWPHIGKNNTLFTDGVGVPGGWHTMHGSTVNPNVWTAIRWVAPPAIAKGAVRVEINTVAPHGAAASTMVLVKNGQYLASAEGFTTAQSLMVEKAVVAGDTFDLLKQGGSNMGFEYIVTAMDPTCLSQETFLPTDLNQDCYINLEDFALFAQDWLKCNDPLDPACTDMP